MVSKKASQYGITAAQVRDTKLRITTEPKFALRVFQVVWAAQRPEERFTNRHMGHDGVGWREFEAYTLNRFYEVLEGQKWLMTPAQMEYLMEKTEPYAEQFLRLNHEESERRRRQIAEKKAGRRGIRNLSKEERERIMEAMDRLPD